MKNTILTKKQYMLSLLGYVFVGAASNGFYQMRYFHEKGLSPFVWIALGLIGSVLLVIKNVSLSNNKKCSAFVDVCFVVPVALIPLIPLRHDIMMIVMLVYACAFLASFVFKNHKNVKRQSS